MRRLCDDMGIPGLDAAEAARLATLLRGAVRRGEFVLASGRKSDLYVDAKQVTWSAEGLASIGRAAAAVAREVGATAAGGLAAGADPIALAAALASLASGAPLKAFSVRKTPKEHGTRKWIEGPPLAREDRVLVVDDVVTTAGSTLQAVSRVREEAGATVVAALCVLDREEGGREALASAGVPLHALFRRGDVT